MSITYESPAKQIRQIVHHHAVLRRGLERRAWALCEAAENGVPFQRQLAILRVYLEEEILPHAKAEERTLYRAAATQARGSDLVRALTAEHHALAYLAGRLVPGRPARTWHGRPHRRRRRGMDRDTVRRARGEGERPAAPRARRLRRGPCLPARGHARAAGRRASVRGGDHHVSGFGAFSLAARHHGGGRRRPPGSLAHPGVPRRA